MKKSFELSSGEWQQPEETKVHYDENELEAAKAMYGSNDYDEWKTPDQYVSKDVVSEATEKKLAEFKKKKIGASIFDLFRGVAA